MPRPRRRKPPDEVEGLDLDEPERVPRPQGPDRDRIWGMKPKNFWRLVEHYFDFNEDRIRDLSQMGSSGDVKVDVESGGSAGIPSVSIGSQGSVSTGSALDIPGVQLGGVPGQGAYPGQVASQSASASPYGGLESQMGSGGWQGFWGPSGASQPNQMLSPGGSADLVLANTGGVPPTAAVTAGPVQASATSMGSAGGPYTGAVPAEQVALAEKYGSQYGVDPAVLLAIAKHETQFGTKGLGPEGYTLGYGATGSGNIPGLAGLENQYREGAEDLAQEGVKTIADIPTKGVQAWQAEDPNWAAGVTNAYESIVPQMGAPSGGAAPIGQAHLGGLPLVEYQDPQHGPVPVGAPIADVLQAASAYVGVPITLSSAGDGYRTPEIQAGSKGGLKVAPGESFHEAGLAIDVNLEALTPEQQGKLVEFWKTQVPGGVWGGDWDKYEPWHFSIGEQGGAEPEQVAAQIAAQQSPPRGDQGQYLADKPGVSDLVYERGKNPALDVLADQIRDDTKKEEEQNAASTEYSHIVTGY